jgi:hypothetical protein
LVDHLADAVVEGVRAAGRVADALRVVVSRRRLTLLTG